MLLIKLPLIQDWYLIKTTNRGKLGDVRLSLEKILKDHGIDRGQAFGQDFDGTQIRKFLGKVDDIFTSLADAIKMEIIRECSIEQLEEVTKHLLTYVVFWIN